MDTACAGDRVTARALRPWTALKYFGQRPATAWRSLEQWAVHAVAQPRDLDGPGHWLKRFEVGPDTRRHTLPERGYTLTSVRAVLQGVGVVVFDRHALAQLAVILGMELPVIERAAVDGTSAFAKELTDRWSATGATQSWQFRTDGDVLRAILSDRYTRVDTVPLIRTLAGPMQALGVQPVRAFHSPTTVRLEFAAIGKGTRWYDPGFVVRNSEVADGAVTITPAIVGAQRYATALDHPEMLVYRHTGHATDRLAAALDSRLAPLLTLAAQSLTMWESLRFRQAPLLEVGALVPALEGVVGRVATREIIGEWRERLPAKRTYTQLLRDAAARVRDLSALEQTRTDTLLHTFLALYATSLADASPVCSVRPSAACADASGTGVAPGIVASISHPYRSDRVRR